MVCCVVKLDTYRILVVENSNGGSIPQVFACFILALGFLVVVFLLLGLDRDNLTREYQAAILIEPTPQISSVIHSDI